MNKMLKFPKYTIRQVNASHDAFECIFNEPFVLFNGLYKLQNILVQNEYDQYMCKAFYRDRENKPQTQCIFIDKNNFNNHSFGSQIFVNHYLLTNINKADIYYFCSEEVRVELDLYCNELGYYCRSQEPAVAFNIKNLDNSINYVLNIILCNFLVREGLVQDVLPNF